MHTKAQIVAALNKLQPVAAEAKLGDLLVELIGDYNALLADVTEMRTKYNALLAKLDADAGVTDTNYAATQAAAALTATTVGDIGSR